MRFVFLQRQFHLNWKATIVVVAMLLIMCRLGLWQLDRGAEKKAFLESVMAGQQEPIEVLYKVPDSFVDWVYRKVEVQGDYLVEQQFLLDNQFSGDAKDKRAGFDVLTPLVLQDQSVILVNRGWLPRQQDKALIPDVMFVPEDRKVQGIIRVPGKQFTLGEDRDGLLQWPKVIQAVDIARLAQYLQRDIQPVVLMLLPTEQHGYSRAWQGKHDIKMGPAVHYGYAFQWFALSATLLVLSFGLLIKKSEKVL